MQSGYAGYKDWFIREYNRPGYTIEAGEGENPLPMDQFPQIYQENRGILIGGMTQIWSHQWKADGGSKRWV